MKNQPKHGSKKLDEAVAYFFDTTPPERLSRGLRNMLIDYLCARADGQCAYMQDLLLDIQYLFDLLDVATDELKNKQWD